MIYLHEQRFKFVLTELENQNKTFKNNKKIDLKMGLKK